MFGNTKREPSQRQAAAVGPTTRAAVFGIALISGIVNVLALTSPLFMLQVYDRVLASRSLSTLVGLAILAVALYAFQSVLEIIRSRVLLRIGESFDHKLSGRVHAAIVRLPLETRMPGDGLQPLRDLDNVRGFLSSPGPTALFDLPWMPLYLGICFLFHFWLGMTALIGAVVLVSITVLTDRLSVGPTREATRYGISRNAIMEAARRNAEIVRALGLQNRLQTRWALANSSYLGANRRTADVAGAFGSISRTLRMILQSAILGVGAWLVIEQQVSAGVMIASSIMVGRALAPVDLAIGSWKPFLMARQSWERLNNMLSVIPEEPPVMSLPAPKSRLSVEAITIVPPGPFKKPTISGVSFTLSAGSAVGIIGPSGSGKSTLTRVLVGAWTPVAGKVRIDGASFEQWDREALGKHIGYLPQGVELFDGTIAQNISRFEQEPNPQTIVAAAVAAGVHDLILRFESGYETEIGEAGSALSAGQRQRVGLARALYNDPFLVVLDEPNANLDADGEDAVIKAISAVRARGGIAVVVAHRPSAIGAVDHVLLVENGQMKAFGPRDEVLSRVLKAPANSGVGGNGNRSFATTGHTLTPLRVIAGCADSTLSSGDNSKVNDADVKN
ncbi:type I secretion system permease/ATPase [Agrobacterium rosae]|uniref:type I secretion system permease/ATPase n=1 Tax=Agrobacterium rosae TaxID=1972867 RepID=UPI0019D3EA35|nr:type I secretion system permease/ATPase [Agrobacterium rosae]MBN7809280.1 type I secretion system permease/ATPase [Agrobacterium rosae]